VTEPFWRRPKFWEWVELAGAVAALASGIIAVWSKLGGAVWGSACGAAVLVAKFITRRLATKVEDDRTATVSRVIGAILESLYAEYFTRVEDDDRHNHRVTVFVCRPHSDGGKQLVIYRRAGIYAASPTVWRVDDDDESRCEGVVGRIWFLRTKRTVELPEWADDYERKREYAAKGNVSLAQAEQLKIKSRVLSGTVIVVNGQRWGVLILDSKTPGLIAKNKEHVVERYAAMLGRLLAEAKV
jgi:hypothetical protein